MSKRKEFYYDQRPGYRGQKVFIEPDRTLFQDLVWLVIGCTVMACIASWWLSYEVDPVAACVTEVRALSPFQQRQLTKFEPTHSSARAWCSANPNNQEAVKAAANSPAFPQADFGL